ncbi:MAG TPA: hypothetical protein VLR71_18745 [Casimicrobiaceae bacterium]|nr:hypothetical protein [Casimicrobiaceae bacterium]
MRLFVILAVACCNASVALAGGSFNGPPPGAPASFKGVVKEWDVPTPSFPRDPAIAPDGSVYYVLLFGDKLSHFDPVTEKFKEWDLPRGTRPHNVLVDPAGIVWITAQGAGAIGRFDPATERFTWYRVRAGGDPHTQILPPDGNLWFTMAGARRVGRLDRTSGAITEWSMPGHPYGITAAPDGSIWVCLIEEHQLARLDPHTGAIDTIDLGAGAQPFRLAADQAGHLYATLGGPNELARIDPATRKVDKRWKLPAGSQGNAYAVTIDGAGTVWVNELKSDTLVRFDPRDESMQVIPLPSKRAAIRKMVVDQQGRLWYLGTNNAKLGRVE